MSPGLVVLVLSLLLGLQPVTTDLYLPALPAIARDFGAAPAQAQLSLLALLLAFGIAQLVWGPLSDQIGRRRVLLLGLTGYTAAAIGSALSTSMEILVGWRILQGASMGAATGRRWMGPRGRWCGRSGDGAWRRRELRHSVRCADGSCWLSIPCNSGYELRHDLLGGA